MFEELIISQQCSTSRKYAWKLLLLKNFEETFFKRQFRIPISKILVPKKVWLKFSSYCSFIEKSCFLRFPLNASFQKIPIFFKFVSLNPPITTFGFMSNILKNQRNIIGPVSFLFKRLSNQQSKCKIVFNYVLKWFWYFFKGQNINFLFNVVSQNWFSDSGDMIF